MDNKQVTAEWIAQQRQISEIVNMTYEDAPGSVVPLLKQLEKSQTAALDALEAAYAEIARLTARAEAAEAERDACKADLKSMADWYRDSVCDDGICGWCKQDADHGLDGDANECAGFYKNDCFEWRGPTSANTDAPTGAGSEAARKEATIARLTAEAGRISLAEEEKDTMMKRRKEQIEVIRTRIDKGGLCDVEKRLLDDLNLPSNYDRRSCTPRTEGYKDD